MFLARTEFSLLSPSCGLNVHHFVTLLIFLGHSVTTFALTLKMQAADFSESFKRTHTIQKTITE
jgi:hypothetical protein